MFLNLFIHSHHLYTVDLLHPTTSLFETNHNNAQLGRYVHAFLSHSPHPCCATFHVGIDLNDKTTYLLR